MIAEDRNRPVLSMNGTTVEICDSSQNKCNLCGSVLGSEPGEWQTVFCPRKEEMQGDVVKVIPPFGATDIIGLCELEIFGIVQ